MNKTTLKKIISTLVNIINIFFIILSVALALIAIFKKDWFLAFIDWMKIVIDWLWFWNYIIAFLSSMLEAFPVLGVVLPWQNILLIVWGFFGEISNFNLIWIIIIASIWALIWNYIWFILWKYYWDSFFKKYWIWFWIGQTEVRYLKKWINKWGPWWITIWKFHPMTRSFLPFIAWSMWMKSAKFMFYNALGSVIRATTIILLWVVFVSYYEFLVEHSWKISMFIISIVWFYIYKYKRKEFKKYWEEKNAEIEEISRKK